MRALWRLKDTPLPHLYLGWKGKVHFYVSTRFGYSFLQEKTKGGIIYMRQVHGKRVHPVRRGHSLEGAIVEIKHFGRPPVITGDGLLTDIKGLVISIGVADCYPVFLTARDGSFVGLLHVGWRGLKEGIIEEGLRKIEENWRVPRRELIVALGPGICKRHYPVGPEFLQLFPLGIEAKDGKFFLDLKGILVEKLENLGIPKGEVLQSPFCTYEREDLFHSRRREGPSHGRQWAFGFLS